MNILFLANSSWYLKNFRFSTLCAFSSRGNVVCLFPNENTCHSYILDGFFSKTFYLDASSLNPFKEFISFFCLFFGILRLKPSIVFSFNPKTNLYALVACWILHIPCVANVSGVGVASEIGGIIGKIYRIFVGFFYKRAAYVFFQNKDDYQSFISSGWVDLSKSEILPGSGVDLVRFTPTEKESDTFRFLMAARLIKPKGVLEFIEAAQKVLKGCNKKCEFILAGITDSSSRAVPYEILKSLERIEHIHFVGQVNDMPALLKNIDCVVLPTYYPEGTPRSLLEAAASGKIILTTDTPGCRDVVLEGENGFFVEPKSSDDLAVKMFNVLNLKPHELNKMKKASRVLAEKNFDEQIVIQRYLKISDELIGNTVGRGD